MYKCCGVLLEKNFSPNKMIAEALNKISKNYVLYVGNPKLMNNGMAEISLFLPLVKEQEKISKFFEKLDQLISFYQHKLDGLIKFKNSFLDILFQKMVKIFQILDLTDTLTLGNNENLEILLF